MLVWRQVHKAPFVTNDTWSTASMNMEQCADNLAWYHHNIGCLEILKNLHAVWDLFQLQPQEHASSRGGPLRILCQVLLCQHNTQPVGTSQAKWIDCKPALHCWGVDTVSRYALVSLPASGSMCTLLGLSCHHTMISDCCRVTLESSKNSLGQCRRRARHVWKGNKRGAGLFQHMAGHTGRLMHYRCPLLVLHLHALEMLDKTTMAPRSQDFSHHDLHALPVEVWLQQHFLCAEDELMSLTLSCAL